MTSDALAHAYGENTFGPESSPLNGCGVYSDVASVIDSKRDFPYYCRRNTTVQEFAFRFNEYNPSDSLGAFPRFTDRVITASSGRCNEYNQTNTDTSQHVGNPRNDSQNYISAVNFTYTNGTYDSWILIPTSALGNDGTTYIFRGARRPSVTEWAFGDRGLWMWVYKNFGTDTATGGDPGQHFYECPISISTVANMHDPRQEFSNATARLAAASIALQGQFKRMDLGMLDWTQWQWYANG